MCEVQATYTPPSYSDFQLFHAYYSKIAEDNVKFKDAKNLVGRLAYEQALFYKSIFDWLLGFKRNYYFETILNGVKRSGGLEMPVLKEGDKYVRDGKQVLLTYCESCRQLMEHIKRDDGLFYCWYCWCCKLGKESKNG